MHPITELPTPGPLIFSRAAKAQGQPEAKHLGVVGAISAASARGAGSCVSEHLQLPLLLELAGEGSEVHDVLLARLDERLLRGDGAVGLNAKFHDRDVGVLDHVAGVEDRVELQERAVDKVAEGVILLVECKDNTIWHACTV